MEQRVQLRKVNGNSPARLSDGTGYIAWGITPSGFCMNDVTERDRLLQTLRNLESHVRENEAEFRTAARLHSGELLGLKRVLDEGGIWFYEARRHIRFNLNTGVEFYWPR